MRFIYAGVLAIATLVAAQDDPAAAIAKLPPCALQCLIQGVGNTTCTPTDYYCQCTTGAQDILKHSVPCLCTSECTPDQLTTALTVSNSICEAVFKAKGQDFQAQQPDPNVCAAYGGGTTQGGTTGQGTTGQGTTQQGTTGTVPTYGGTNQTNQTNVTTGASPTGSFPAQNTGGAATVEFAVEAVLVGVVGLAVMVL